MRHHCHATGCNRTVPPERLMCFPHWVKVPKAIQRRIWAAYRPGQCDDWEPSAEYLEAAIDAVTAVAKKEGKVPDLSLYTAFQQYGEIIAKIKRIIEGKE